MMNRAIIDAFGLASSPEESHNVSAREVMVRVREAAEQMKQSATGRVRPHLKNVYIYYITTKTGSLAWYNISRLKGSVPLLSWVNEGGDLYFE